MNASVYVVNTLDVKSLVAAMGLERAQGLYPVQVQRLGTDPNGLLPNTATR
jgi:hypothetical protein